MPLKEEQIEDINRIRKQIKEVIIFFLVESARDTKLKKDVAFTAFEIAELKEKQILEISKQNKQLGLNEMAEVIGEVEIALESIIEEQNSETKAGKRNNNFRDCNIDKIEWRGEIYYKASISHMR